MKRHHAQIKLLPPETKADCLKAVYESLQVIDRQQEIIFKAVDKLKADLVVAFIGLKLAKERAGK